jgi:hypothetical protein
MVDRSKHNSGRRRNPKVPPPVSQVVAKERVILTAADLTELAATAELRLALDGPTLDDIASDLSRLLGAYVLWQRMERSGASPSDVRDWAGPLAQLARDTVMAIGGNAALPCDLETSEAHVFPGWWHLATRGLPGTADDPKQVDAIARLLCLAGAASSPTNGQSVEAVQLAITRTIYSLSAIAILADRTAAHAASEASSIFRK